MVKKKKPKRRVPTAFEVAKAKRELDEEIAEERRSASSATTEVSQRRSELPSEHPDHICGVFCDGQDGQTSYCYRLRKKLFGRG